MDKLAKHRKIALDLDGTLIDGVASLMLGNYVKQHPDKSFFIITFRTPQQAASIPSELRNNDLSTGLFDRIVPMPARLAVDFDDDQRFRRTAALPSIDRVAADALLPGEFKLMHWKGFIASKLGATALVDDMPNLAALGCRKFHVALISVAEVTTIAEGLNIITSMTRPKRLPGVCHVRTRLEPIT